MKVTNSNFEAVQKNVYHRMDDESVKELIEYECTVLVLFSFVQLSPSLGDIERALF